MSDFFQEMFLSQVIINQQLSETVQNQSRIIVYLTNQNQDLQNSASNFQPRPTPFKDSDTFSMEQNDGVLAEGEVIFEIDDFDKDLLEEAERAETV